MKPQTIAVTSFKGGTAKTSTAIHLGAALAKFHRKKVLLVDFDAQANLTAGLGYDPDELDSLAPVLQGTREITSVIQKTEIKHLHLIPADTWLERIEVSGPLAADRYSHERLARLLQPLSYDVIIVDTPPSLCWLTESALIAAEHALVCSTPEFFSIKGLERLAQFLHTVGERHPIDVLGVAISFWNARGKNNQTFMDVVERTFPGKALSSRVRRDIAISEASIYGKPVFETAERSRGSEDYRSLGKEVLKRIKAN